MKEITENMLIDYASIQGDIMNILYDVHGYNNVAGLFYTDKTIAVFYFCTSERAYVYDSIPHDQILGNTETIKKNIKQAKLLKDPEYQQYLKLKGKFE